MNQKSCKIKDCNKASRTRGMCQMHYLRFWKHGDALMINSNSHRCPVSERIKKKTEINEHGCWIWTGKKNPNGYGIIQVNNTQIGVHVVAYELKFGKLPQGFIVCHKCDVRDCVNPDHLFSGTHKHNSFDMISKNRCKPPNKRLSPISAAAIRRSTLTPLQISSQFNITRQHAQRVQKGQSWRTVV